ncbi:MAG: phosphotransferase [Bacteroidales bacterium]|nr:phosphotransferase [Bacteroidales bacterium]MBQ9653992.1 phosphotransferase [Bacteroidales bacterium]MBR1782458.1 phosphotransferase [Bacteroidales bacterium]
MEAKHINLNEWESFGGGGFGESFYNKTDDSVILKLNKTSVSAQKAQEEFRRSKAVYDMGIPSAEPYEFVTDGERYGMIVQRIRGKESFGRILADHPERLEELSGITADYAKTLHATPCNTEVFDDMARSTRAMIAANKTIPEDIKASVLGYIDELEPATTCLHGDLNPCNIITAEGKVYWIDLGDFGYGDPLLDFCIMEHMSHLGQNPLLRHVFHVDRKTLRRYYESFERHYFGERWGSAELREKMDRIAHIQAAKALCIWPSAYHVNLPFLQGKRLKTAINLFIGDHLKMK